MKNNLRKYLQMQAASLSLLSVLVFAQPSDLAENLAACKNGRDSCDRSKLTQSESVALTLADHARNVRA